MTVAEALRDVALATWKRAEVYEQLAEAPHNKGKPEGIRHAKDALTWHRAARAIEGLAERTAE